MKVLYATIKPAHGGFVESSGQLKWNVSDIANALHISPNEVLEYFTDGRRVSFIIERRLCNEIMNGQLARTEGAAFDLIDEQGRKWEVRSISRGGVYFCPSYMVGSGRSFEQAGFISKLQSINGYILADIVAFPTVPFWIVDSSTVQTWWSKGLLGTTSKISRKTALYLLDGLL